MATWSPLTTHWAVNLVDCSSRQGAVIDTIQNHHTATNNKMVALGLFAPGGRTVTPNYFVAGKEIWGIVPEEYRAYTSGSAFDDRRGITIETLNLTNAPSWQFAADTLETLAALNADIASRYGIPLTHGSPGVIEHRNIYSWWRRSYATACAGPSFSMPDHLDRVRAAIAPPSPKPVQGEDEMSKPIIAMKLDGGPMNTLGVMIEPDGTVTGLDKGQWEFWRDRVGCVPVECKNPGHWEYLMGVMAERRKRSGVTLTENDLARISAAINAELAKSDSPRLSAAEIAEQLQITVKG